MRSLTPVSLIALVLLVHDVAAQASGAMLYTYRPHRGEEASFEEGYRTHLQWHREHCDSLPWYGWSVIAGRRVGQFVDGTFGIAYAALDHRVDPPGDAADARRTFVAHARATRVWAVRLRPTLGTVQPLGSGSPTALAQVVTFRLPPYYQAAFERDLRRVRQAATTAGLLPFTVYESVVGAADAEFMVMVWRDDMATFDDSDQDPIQAIRRALSSDVGAVLQAESELWRFRPDMTLIPARNDGPGGDGDCF